MKNTPLKFTILSMSMLTVMAMANIAPALASIQEHFTNATENLIKMTLTLPSLMVVIVNLIFPTLSKKITIRNLALIGLSFYTFAGALGGFVNNITLLLTTRILMGIGVGFIMPLSTGLLAYYFDSNEQHKLMGYAVAMNNVGGILSLIIAGFLANIKWQYCFYLYLLGILIIIAIYIFIPNEKITTNQQKINKELLKIEWFPITSVFLVMIAFYTYITHFSIQAIGEKIIAPSNVGLIMASQSIAALLFSLSFGRLHKLIGNKIKYLGLSFFLLAFIMLTTYNSKTIYTIALFLIGSGMGIFFPYINATSVKKVQPNMAPTVMALLTISIYIGQFLSPTVSNIFATLLKSNYIRLPYIVAIGAILLTITLSFTENKT